MRHNIYYFSPSFVPWCGRPSSPSLPLVVAEPLSLPWSSCGGRILLGEEEEEGEKASISWSLVSVLIFFLGEASSLLAEPS